MDRPRQPSNLTPCISRITVSRSADSTSASRQTAAVLAEVVCHRVDGLSGYDRGRSIGPTHTPRYRIGIQADRGRIISDSFGTRCFTRRWVRKEFSMSYSVSCKLLLVAVLLSPIPAFAQGGGGGGAGGGGSAGGASAGSASDGGASRAAVGAPRAGSAGAGTAAVSGVTGPANVGGLNNSGNDPSGTGNAAKASNTPGTNSAGTANSSGATSTTGRAPMGSTTVGTAGNPAGGAVGGRIDGTVTPGPAMPGDDTIRGESSQDSMVDKKIKSICKGC